MPCYSCVFDKGTYLCHCQASIQSETKQYKQDLKVEQNSKRQVLTQRIQNIAKTVTCEWEPSATTW